MATSPKIWRKLNGQWVKTTPDVSKDDVGLGNVENFTHTNSATDGSSSKYATGAAAKQAYDRATQALNKANSSVSLGPVQLSPGSEAWNVIESYDPWSQRNHDSKMEAQGSNAMAAYAKIAKDRNDTLLTGIHRKHKHRAPHVHGGIRIRVYYRRIL